ncbi:hypothetical protein IWQ62_002903, partial [Dispira parvispora]
KLLNPLAKALIEGSIQANEPVTVTTTDEMLKTKSRDEVVSHMDPISRALFEKEKVNDLVILKNHPVTDDSTVTKDTENAAGES